MSAEQEPTRSSRRQRVRRAAAPDDTKWSLEGMEGLEGGSEEEEEGAARPRRAPASRATTQRSRQRKAVVTEELERQARVLEGEVAELLPMAAAWQERHATLQAQNQELRGRVQALAAESSSREASLQQLRAELGVPVATAGEGVLAPPHDPALLPVDATSLLPADATALLPADTQLQQPCVDPGASVAKLAAAADDLLV